jgi:hypothetical protein
LPTLSFCKHIVTCISIARQRVAKHILAATNTQAAIEELPFLCNGNVNTPLYSITIEELLGYGVLSVFSVRVPCRRFIGDNAGRLQSVKPHQ